MDEASLSGSEMLLADALLEAAETAGLAARSVEALRRLGGGASKDMWAFDLLLDNGTTRELVLRRHPQGKRFSSQGLDSVGREAAIIRFAAQAGVPVPAIAFELPPGSHGGDGYAMERLVGETVGGRVLKLPELAPARANLARRCGEILARLTPPMVTRNSAFARKGRARRSTLSTRAIETRARTARSSSMPCAGCAIICPRSAGASSSTATSATATS